MPRPMTQDGDTVREMTVEEHAAYKQLQDELTSQVAAADAKAVALASARKKLAALGLTEAEVAALLGA